MNTQAGSEDAIAEEAIEWLIRLCDTASAGGNALQEPSVQSAAFFDWLKRSPDHLRIYMEFVELGHRGRQVDPTVFDTPLAVQEDPAPDVQVAASDNSPAAQESPEPQVVAHTRFRPNRRRTIACVIAVGCVAIALGAFYFSSRSQVYRTQVGEQQRRILQDGSVIELNTNSQVEVNFSRKGRAIRLIRGEAFFEVKHVSSDWPFIVTAADTSVHAVGTQFDVRQTSREVEVAVVSGTVQLAVEPHESKDASAKALETPPQRLKASETAHVVEFLIGGEMATISSGKVVRVRDGNVDDALSWRRNRLVFDHVRLADVAATFNRYNRVQIRVEGAAAQDIRLSGIFDTGGYRDVLWHVQTREHLVALRDGENWVIRANQ